MNVEIWADAAQFPEMELPLQCISSLTFCLSELFTPN